MAKVFLEKCEKSQNGYVAPEWVNLPFSAEDVYPEDNEDEVRGIAVDIPDSWVTDDGKSVGIAAMKELRLLANKQTWDRAVCDAIVALHCFLSNFDEGDSLYMPVSTVKSRGSSLQVPHGSWY
tara:strand:+ start:1010 stop:1378 length:369 start_codon:yes stop_codon:yes gene_type:complete